MSHTIKSLTDLLIVLARCGPKDYRHVAKNLDIPYLQFEPYLLWNKLHYTRTCLMRTEDYELVLLCWEEGQQTPIHCHGGMECWVHMVQGELEEKRFEQPDATIEPTLTNKMALTSSHLSYMNDDMGFHSLRNIYPGRSISLHLYAKPIDSCEIYNSDTGKGEARELSYDAYAEIPERINE